MSAVTAAITAGETAPAKSSIFERLRDREIRREKDSREAYAKLVQRLASDQKVGDDTATEVLANIGLTSVNLERDVQTARTRATLQEQLAGEPDLIAESKSLEAMRQAELDRFDEERRHHEHVLADIEAQRRNVSSKLSDCNTARQKLLQLAGRTDEELELVKFNQSAAKTLAILRSQKGGHMRDESRARIEDQIAELEASVARATSRLHEISLAKLES